MKEIWRDIDGFEGKYQVSTWGNVRGKGGILSPYRNEKGYMKVGLLDDSGRVQKKRVHRLVAVAFIPNPYNLPQVNHKDGNVANNSITNLEWVTNEQNARHAMNLRQGIFTL